MVSNWKNAPGVYPKGNIVKQDSQDDNECAQTRQEGDLFDSLCNRLYNILSPKYLIAKQQNWSPD